VPLLLIRYKVDGSSWSKQLPTVILFVNGKEKMRRPYVDYKGTVQKFYFSEVSYKYCMFYTFSCVCVCVRACVCMCVCVVPVRALVRV